MVRYRRDIDGLRALAVLPVILFHAGREEFAGGYVGVDVFFVVSGYLITGLISRERAAGEFSFRRFYIRRVRRLFPALALTVSMTLLFGALILDPLLLQETGYEAVSTVLSFSNIFFYRTSGYFEVRSELKPLLHTWSLSLEEQFYLIWPALFVFFGRSRRLTIGGPIALAIISLVASELVLSQDPSAAFYWLPTRMFELMLGAVLVLGERGRTTGSRTSLWSEALAFGGLGFLAYAVHQFDAQTRFPGLWALTVSLATAAVIFGGQSRWGGALLRFRPIAFIGKISYSAYLVHWPLIVFGTYVLRRSLDAEETLALVALSLTLAAGMYFLIEMPFRRGTLPFGERRSARPFLLGCAGVSLAILGVSADVVRSQGWPWRVEPDQMVLGEGELQHGSDPCGLSNLACEIGVKSDYIDFAILGDSHARHFIYGLDGLAKRYEYSGIALTHGACALMEGALTQSRGVDREDCVHSRVEAFRQLDELEPKLIFMSQAYLGYTRAFRDTDGRPLAFETQRDLGAHWASLLDATVKRLRRPGRKFVVLLTTLRPKYDPARCVGRPRYLTWRDSAGECVRSDSDALLRKAGDLEDVIVEWASQTPDVSVLDPKAVQCPRGRCVIAQGAELHYEDDHHLSAAGSRFVIDGLAAEILPMLREAPHDRPSKGPRAPRLWDRGLAPRHD